VAEIRGVFGSAGVYAALGSGLRPPTGTPFSKILGIRPCSQWLTSLDLESLEMKRLRQDLHLTYKIAFGWINIDSGNFSTLSRNSNTRWYSFKLFLSHSRLMSENTFCQCVVRKWNNLPACVDRFYSITTFKRFLSITKISINCNDIVK